MKAVRSIVPSSLAVSVALALGVFLGGCATSPGRAQVKAAEVAETKMTGTEAAKIPATGDIVLEESYFLNRGVEAGLNQVIFIQDYGQPLFAFGEKSGQFYRFEASSGKYFRTFDAKGGKKFGAKSLFRSIVKYIFVVDPENQRIQLWKQDFSTQVFGDIPFTVAKNPVALEIELVPQSDKVRLNIIDDTDGKRTLVQVDLTMGYAKEEFQFDPKALFYDTPKITPLPPSAKVGDTAALKVDALRNQLWVASGKEIFVLNSDGSASDIPPFNFDTPVYGLDVMACKRGDQLGYWMIGTQASKAYALAPFKIIDRGTLKPVGQFSTPLVKKPTDMVFSAIPIGLFPMGAVFVASEGTGIASVDWAKIAEANGLRPNCF